MHDTNQLPAASRPLTINKPASSSLWISAQKVSKTLLSGLIAVMILLTARDSMATTYYSGAATGDPTSLSAWWTGTGGTGSHPADFTSGDTFIIQNGHNYTLATSAIWVVNATTGGTAATVQINATGKLTYTLGVSGSPYLKLGGNFVQTAAGSYGIVGSGTTSTGYIEFTANGSWTGTGDLSSSKISVIVDSGATLDASGMSAGFKLKSSNSIGITANGTLIMGTLTINGNGNASASFALGTSGTLITATTSASGLPGIFTGFSSGKITLPTTANYVFNGIAAQVTGTTANNATMPSTVNNLTISNSSTGVTLTQPTTVNGTLALTLGKVTGNVTLGSSATISGGSGTAYLNGQLTVPFTTPSSASYTFPIGTASAYSPISLANFSDTSGGTLTASATAATPPNLGSSGIDGSLYIARYWTLTGSGFSSPTYDFAGTYVAGDIQNSADPANLIVRKWDGSSWAGPAASSSVAYTVTGTSFATSFGQFAAGQAQTTIPILDATTKSAITNTAVTLGATLENNFSLAITDYGIVWGTSASPTTSDNKVQVGTTTPTLGSPFTASVTGLPAATTIYYRGYAISSSGTGYTTNNSFLTLANEPTTQAANVVCSTLQNGSIPISWTRGNGAKCIVLVSASSPVDAPVDGTTYTASATFSSGATIGSSHVAYLGTGTNVTLTGLSTSTTYYVVVYELNGSGGSENYLTDSPATGSQLTGATFVTSLTWTGTVDTDWNKTGNWDGALIPDVGTPVIIPIASIAPNQPIYTNVMAAPSFGALVNAGILTVNTNGFNSGALTLANTAENSATTGAKLFIGSNGVVNVSGAVLTTSNAWLTVAGGGSLTASGGLSIGSGSSIGSCGAITNSGGTINVASTSLNSGNASLSSSTAGSGNCLMVISGGVNNLGSVSVGRSTAGSGGYITLGTEGLMIYSGSVTMSGLNVGGGNGNSFLSTLIAGGTVTNKGSVLINQLSSARGSRLLQKGGLFVVTNLVNPNPTVSGSLNVYSVTGGTNIVGGVSFGYASGSAGNVYFTNGAVMYVGSQGIAYDGAVTLSATLSGGSLLGANADWTGSAPMQLDAGTVTIQAADMSGTAHNITISGALSGTGALTKTGNGTLTLNAADTYSGNTLINAGKLAVGAVGSLNNTGKFYVGSGATFDVSAVTGGFPISNQTLTGLGVITGAVTVAASATTAIDPGSNTLTGTLSFSNSITETGGAINHFDLAGAPNPNNDLVVIAGDFNVSGTNTMDIGGSSLVVGSVYPLVNYGGNFNGDLTNFVVTSVVGILTNDATAKTISFIPQATLRGATNIVWIGNPANTNWDTEVSTNWVNAGVLDYFVPKDNVQFTDAGASNSPINIVGTVTPTTVLVNSRSNYVFATTDGGAIGDSTSPASLTVTNTGTLTVLTTNTYTGTTTIDGGGALAVSYVANISSASPVGKSDTLVINNGTFIYSGPNASTDRGATLGNAASAISVSANGSLTLNGTLGGAGGLTKTGNGNLILPNANGFAGGTFVNAGTLTLNSAGAVGAGTITLNGGKLALGAVKPANTVNVAADSIVTGGNSGGSTGIKNVTGSANLLLAVTASSGVFDLTGDMSTYSGNITISNAGGIFVRFNGTTGSALATWDLGAGVMDLNIRTSSTSNNIGALKGGSSTTLSGRGGSGNSGASTYYIGANGLNTTFEGVIQNGIGTGSVPSTSSATSINKLGSGSLALTGASTYTGSTTVSSGTLEVDGSLASGSTVTVNGGTLAGSGTIGGATTLNAGTVLSAGSGSVGTLTFSGNLTLDSASTNSFAVTTAGGASNSVSVAGTLYPNSSVIQITSGTALAVGTYTLFNHTGGVSGSFNSTPVFDVAPAATASIVDTGSQINLVIGTPVGPTISSITTSGSDITLNAAGGTPGGSVSVLTSTDLSLPLASWNTVTTGNFDGSGNYSYTVTDALISGQPQQFYILQTP
jgi:autotransporter-associated beta strand protein